MSKQTVVMDRITNLDLNTQGLGEKFLEYIQDATKWKADLIRAIHQERVPPGDRAQYDHGYLSERREKLQRALIASLCFSEMTDRPNRIVEAHEKTFQWIFLPGYACQQKWTNFSEWLEGKSTLYWVTGKAGSGKSTLLKYLHRDKRTMDRLKKWAPDVPLVTAAFFFWKSGTQMQMSGMGFLQSMLSQVLTKHPALIPRILPERWETFDLFGHDESIWSEPELRRAFRLLARDESPEAKFCFFIDGLDEFEGDHTNLIELIKEIGSSSNIKICVSSRPWVLFEDAFKHKPSLMLQDLTYRDIIKFIDSAFHNKPEFVELEKREPQYASGLLEDIAQKSAGVFLWVSLVVRSLLAGLVNGDRVSDLKRRLALLPPDLENLYEKMLNSLDPFYLEHASQIFQHVREAKEPPSLLCLSFADEEPEFVPQMKVQPLSEDEKFSRVDIMRRRLNSRCKGLLEVGPAVSLVSEALDTRDLSLIQDPMSINDRLAEGVSLVDFTVQYLHRTVKDFLETPQVWGRIMLAGPPTYDPHLALCRSFIAQLKCLDPGSSRTEAFRRTVSACMFYAYVAQDRLEEGQSAHSLVSLVDEIDRTATNFHDVSIKEPSWPSMVLSYLYPDLFITPSLGFLSFAVRLGLHTYVEAKVHRGCLTHDIYGVVPLLSDATWPCKEYGHSIFIGTFPSVRMVKMLLNHGADANMVCLTDEQRLTIEVSSQRINTVWHDLLRHSAQSFSVIIGETRWAEVIYWFLVYGADATVDLGNYHRVLLRGHLSEDQYNRVLAIMKAGRRRTWFTEKKKKNPNLDPSGHLKGSDLLVPDNNTSPLRSILAK